MSLKFNQITEATDTGVTFTYGRFNPPTVGHMKLAAKMKALAKGNDVKIFTSNTTDRKKNPLTSRQIKKFMDAMLPRGIKVADESSRTVFVVLTDLYTSGYRDIQMVVGSDRIEEFNKLITKYNGIKSTHGYYKFDSIKVVSAGARDPDSDGVDGMSASKMRLLALQSDEKAFIDALPTGYRFSKQLYKAVQKGMGINEDFPSFMYEIYNPQQHEWGTEAGREYAQDHTPGQNVLSYAKKKVQEQEMPKEVLLDKEKMYKDLKKERDNFVKQYGSRADEVMHATAMTMAKNKHGIN